MTDIGRTLMVVGGLILALGIVLSLTDRVPLVGRLPGDLTFRGDGWVVYAPLATMLVVSLALTALLSLVSWLGNR